MRPKNEETKMQIYEYINEYFKINRVSPTVREIASGVNCGVATAYKFLCRLQEEGYIDMAGKRRITSSVNNWVMDYAPILGMIACGKPHPAIEDIQGYLPINTEYLGKGEYFALIATGDSMINVGIDDGDIVLVRKQSSCDDGQIAVVLTEINECDGECSATLKRLYHDDKRQLIRLHPENDCMEDFYVKEAEVLGVAVKVIKNLE